MKHLKKHKQDALISVNDVDRYVADARDEVITKIEIWTENSLRNGNIEEYDCLNELKYFLATLRNE